MNFKVEIRAKLSACLDITTGTRTVLCVIVCVSSDRVDLNAPLCIRSDYRSFVKECNTNLTVLCFSEAFVVKLSLRY